MAKYTELLADYLNSGGQLPAAFNLIEGFEDKFKLKYYDKEIGLETEDLFAMKLELTAELYIPQYVEQIEALTFATTGLKLPVRTFHTKSNIINDIGKQVSKATDRPINTTNATPNMITESDATQNTANNDSTTEEQGFTNQAEAFEMVSQLNKVIEPLIVDLLNKFSNLFMKIY